MSAYRRYIHTKKRLVHKMNDTRRKRRIAILFLMMTVLSLFLASAGACTEKESRGIPVLTYHRVVKHEVKMSNRQYKNNKWVNDLDNFESNMKYLHDNGYRTLSMDEFYDWYCGRLKVNEDKTVVITFDDGNAEDYYNVLPVMKKYGLRGTCFVIGENVLGKRSGSLTPELIEKLRTEYDGLEIQSHTYGYHKILKSGKGKSYPMPGTTAEDFRADCIRMTGELGAEYLAYPFGVKADFCPDVLAECGYRLAFGFGQGDLPYGRAMRTDNPYYIHRIKVDAEHEGADTFPALLK